MDKAIALYYVVKEETTFEVATQEILKPLIESNKRHFKIVSCISI